MPSILLNNLRFFDKSGSDISPIISNEIWTATLRIPDTSVGLHEVAHIFIGENVINTSNVITRNATTVEDSPIVTFTSGTTKNLKAGMWIQGTNIPSGSKIQSIKNQTQILIDADLGASGTGSTTLTMHPQRYKLTLPRTNDSSKIKVKLQEQSDNIFLFDVAYEETMPVINKVTAFSFDIDDGSSDSLLFNHREISNSEIKKELLQINIAATAKIEGPYTNTIIIEEVDIYGNVTTLAQISLIFEAIGEDERFKSLLENFGKSIDSNDYIAFRNTDIKEDKINYKELNTKRKEMLLSGSDIWPYLGSYKGLINALKFFGYGDLRLKEYWLNVDKTSKNEGKMITMNVPLSLDYTTKEFDDYKKFINGIAPNQPSKIFRKTAKFGLFYDINRDTGNFDEDGLPITEDAFEFTNEEILIKLFSLKKILKEKFLPLNARIIDITGEGVYYDNIGINSWNIPTPTFHITVEKNVEFEASPINGYLSDLTSQFTNNCDLNISTKLSDKADANVIDYSYCIIESDLDSDGNPLVEKHPRYARKIGFQTVITNLTDDYMWDQLTMTWEEAGEKTWDNLRYQDYQTMRWIVRSVERNSIIYDNVGEIGTLDIIRVTLPYLGFYDVTLELIDHFNFRHRQTKQNYIEVKPKEADIAAVFRSHESYETWEEIEGTESDLALADMHGTWMDVTINENTTWTEVGDLTWESVDFNRYANQENLFDYFDGNLVNKENEKVGQVISIDPSKQIVKVRGFNNSLLTNAKQQNAYFFKDRTNSDILLLDIVANAAGSAFSVKTFDNNAIQFVSAKEGFIVGNTGKFIHTTDAGESWEAEKTDTANNLNDLSFTSEKNGWIVGDYGTVINYKNTALGNKTIRNVDISTTNNLKSVHFINEDVGFIAGYSIVKKTTNKGLTWENITPIGFTETITSIYFPSTTLGVFVTESGMIYRSIDAGSSWNLISTFTGNILSLHFVDNLYGWAGLNNGNVNKILKTVNGGLTWTEIPIGIKPNSIKFINRQVGYVSGTLTTGITSVSIVQRTQDGGTGWPFLYNSPTELVNIVFPLNFQTIYACGLKGSIIKTSTGGVGNNQWVSQTANQKDYFPIGGQNNVWITETYNGLVFQYEQAILVIKHIPVSLIWTGVDTLTTTWPVGSVQSAIDARYIFFDTPNGRKQLTIKNAKLTIINEVEYILDRYIYDNSEYTSAFVVQQYESVVIDNIPKSESGGLRIRWSSTWNGDMIELLDKMMIMLRLESKDLYCNVLDMEFNGDETTLVLDYTCDIIKKLDSNYFVALKEYDIEQANSKMGTLNFSWETFCKDITWNDMKDKTWNDFEFNGYSYCSYVITKVSRGGVIKVDDEHFFQFPTEEIKQVEGQTINGSGSVTVGTYEFTAETENGSVYVYVDNIKDLEIGMLVTGGGIQNDTFIVAIEDETPYHAKRFEMSKNATTTATTTVICSILNVLNMQIGMQIHGTGIQPGSVITYLDGITPYYYNTFIMSLPATETGTTKITFSAPDLSLAEAVTYLNASDVEGIKSFYYSVPLLSDGVTYANYIVAKAKSPGVVGLHYFEFLYGVESDWEDDPSHSHSYPLGIMKEWTKSEADGGEPLGLNNPPLWNYLYSTYYEFGEWFPVPELLGEYSEALESTRALYTQALDGSFNWQDTKIKRWKSNVTPGTTIFFNSLPSRVAGVKNHEWKLYDNKNTLLTSIKNEFLIWTFCDPGNYSVELQISDIEDNTYFVRRNGFVEVESPEVINHYLPGLGWSDPVIPPNSPIPPSVVTEPERTAPIPEIYKEPSLNSNPSLKYYSTFTYVETDPSDLRLRIINSWDTKDIRNAALYAREFFIEYMDTSNGKIITSKFDISLTSDTSNINTTGFYNAVPNQTYVDYLNENTEGKPYKNISLWKFPNNYEKEEEFYRIRSGALDNYTLNPSQYPGYNVGSLNLFRIYFIPTSTSNG
jgi:photosystem II stability/assembly factor-like uncharacterized protein